VRLLLFSDVHCDADAARRIVERSSAFDVIVGAGDFATARRGLQPVIDILAMIETPTVLVPGNSESHEELRDACRDWAAAHVLHGTETTLGKQKFFGIGGGIPVTPFGSWSYDFTEAQAQQMLAACPAGCVLVTHSPPKGCLDIASNGASLGSTAVRAAIERAKPVLVICGHIHASAGRQEKLGGSAVVNAGPGGVEWELGEGIARPQRA
jgi:Icc-related predicted phosphoesterase